MTLLDGLQAAPGPIAFLIGVPVIVLIVTYAVLVNLTLFFGAARLITWLLEPINEWLDTKGFPK